MSSAPIKVKFLSKVDTSIWLHQLPDNNPSINDVQFIFDRYAREYDWLIVYDDLPASKQERFPVAEEQLACHPDNTILLTIEPSSVKVYGKDYTDQYGHIITSQPASALPHHNRIHSQASLYWFYGVGTNRVRPYSDISSISDTKKTKSLSMVWSNKKQAHTLHHQRHAFLKYMRDNCPNIDIFGADNLKMDDKAESLDPYKYHIAIENHYSEHHWTEKLADAFLGQTLPFYYGCPNLSEYFPVESYIPIDIFKPKQSLETILDAIDNNEYAVRRDAIIKAKKTLLDKYNIFVVIAQLVKDSSVNKMMNNNKVILSRRAANNKTFGTSINYLYQKWRVRFNNLFKHFLSLRPSK